MRRTAVRRPIRLTESKLRQIIRETIEEELIQEGVMSEELKQAAKAALLALGITVTPNAVLKMVDTIQQAAQTVDTKEVHRDARGSVEDEKMQLIDDYIAAMRVEVTGHPTLKRDAKKRKAARLSEIRRALRDAGLSDVEIDNLIKERLGQSSVYRG